MNYDASEIADFVHALRRCGKSSVDTFLEHRIDFLNIGKAAMAAALIPREDEKKLFSEPDDDWYKYVFQQMNATFNDFGKNKIVFITYNYDRSLEHFLHESLKNLSGRTDNECAAIVKKIPIIHLHGYLGGFSWQVKKGRAYSSKVEAGEIKKASTKIQVVSEDVKKIKEFKRAHEALKSADQIFFLGFGYDEVNISRLNTKDWNTNKVIGGTSCGLTELKRKSVENLIGGSVGLHYNRYDKTKTFLEEVVSWI